jgi:hypothetical protein
MAKKQQNKAAELKRELKKSAAAMRKRDGGDMAGVMKLAPRPKMMKV